MLKVIFIFIAALGFFGFLAASNLKRSAPRTETASPLAAPVVAEVNSPRNETKTERRKTPVLVELFTSEGCSSCPPADKNLIYLNEKQPFAEAEVIALSLHVDYWNRLGWTDEFSSRRFSERQSDYSDAFGLDGVYTPQMIVDGRAQFVGGNLDEARRSIVEAAASPKAEVALELTDDKLRVRITDLPEHAASNVFLAIAEDGLLTDVKRGENGGRILNHAAVVRRLETIGRIAPDDQNFVTEAAFELDSDWKKQNLKIVVFVQEAEKTSRIVGAQRIKLSN